MSTVAIIGGGISGLYLSYKLLQKGIKVHLFEQSSRLGGRIHTEYREDGILYDTGAGRFNVSHTSLLKLLRHLGLADKAMPIINKNARMFIKDRQELDYDMYVTKTLFKDIINARKKYTNDYLKSITLKEFMISLIGEDKTNNVINAFGYNSEFEIQNAYTGLEILEHDFSDNIQYFYLQGGLTQIIVLLHEKLIELGCKIHLNTIVNHYNPNNNTIEYINNGTQTRPIKKLLCNKVVFCVTHDALLKFEDLVEHDKKLYKFLKGTQSSPLHRIFARFPPNKDGNVWFNGLKRITTNLPIRYIIPHNPTTGLIQISYTDNKYANYWNNMSKEDLEKNIMKNLKELFPNKRIPKPLWLDRWYWKEGATYWKPNSTPYKNSKDNNYYICGEMTSQFNCGWIEGALRSIDNVIKLFN
jgi:protoporphyrinogen oxidase